MTTPQLRCTYCGNLSSRDECPYCGDTLRHEGHPVQHYERKNGSVDVKRIRQSERVRANDQSEHRR